MGREIDLMRLYPKSKSRLNQRPLITEEDKIISKKYGFDYFDGDRKYGYGGFYYNPKYWQDTVKLFAEFYSLQSNARVLDIGCGKGFMLKDFKLLFPNFEVSGIDISQYAVENSEKEVREFIRIGSAEKLPYADNTFDLVISINTLHNLDLPGCSQALNEIERVGTGKAFIMVDGWKNDKERADLKNWVLTAETVLSSRDWIELFSDCGYTGDYFFWKVE